MAPKMKPVTIHSEVVDASTEKAASRLAEIVDSSFYLAGGTGLALQLGHRISLDLDLFSEGDPLDEASRRRLLTRLKASGELEILENSEGTLHLRLAKREVSLFHYPYPLLDPPQQEWRGLPLAGFRDLGAMKLSAVLGRGSKKDFVDLYVLAKEIGLDALFESGRRRFPDHTNFEMSAGKALTFFLDAEKEPMPRMKSALTWEEVKRFFGREVPRYFRARF